jgi:hypothetical protein
MIQDQSIFGCPQVKDVYSYVAVELGRRVWLLMLCATCMVEFGFSSKFIWFATKVEHEKGTILASTFFQRE